MTVGKTPIGVLGAACVLALAALAAGCGHEPTTPAATQASPPQPAQHTAAKGPWGTMPPPPPSIARQIEQLKAKANNNASPAGPPPAIGNH